MLPMGSCASASEPAVSVARLCAPRRFLTLMHSMHSAPIGEQLTERALPPLLLCRLVLFPKIFGFFFGFGRCTDMKLGQQTR